jgi:phage FluMu protein Com
MDYRCPLCGTNLAQRKLVQAVLVRMERECPGCKRVLELNIHWAEEVTASLGLGTVVVLGMFAYWWQSERLALAAFGAAMLGAAALPLLERIHLRDWPRYRARTSRNDPSVN